MNKKEIVEQLTNLTNSEKKQCELFYDNIFKIIAHYLKKGEDVNIVNFGTFKVSKRKPRMGRNIITKEKLLIKSHKTVTFKISTNFKKELN